MGISLLFVGSRHRLSSAAPRAVRCLDQRTSERSNSQWGLYRHAGSGRILRLRNLRLCIRVPWAYKTGALTLNPINPMNLDDAQKKKVAEWIEQGLKLAEIQAKLASEFGVRMTYMDLRFLVDDLKLTPKDPEPGRKDGADGGIVGAAKEMDQSQPRTQPSGAKPGSVAVSVDQITRPGALVSGKVSFTDGNKAEWYLDQTGRLGLVPQQAGYRPPSNDLQQFQTALESELAKAGF